MLFLKRFSLVIRYFISVLIITSSFLILFFVSLPLFSAEVNELDKKKVIGMKPSVPLEFDKDLLFWWLIKDGNTLEFHNSSDEKIKGDIVLGFESNPCKFRENIELKSGNQMRILEINPDEITQISFPVEIDYKSSIKINAKFTSKEPCLVDNGDSRNFGAKLVSWSFE